MFCSRWLASLLCGFCVLLGAMSARAQDIVFDPTTLRELGIDPALAAYLAQSPRFTPGEHRVTFRLNGRALGSIEARFTDAGELCFDPPLLEAAQLKALPAGEPGLACERFQNLYPQTEVQLDPQNARVDVVVPSEAMRATDRIASLTQFTSGGVAGILNYDLSWAEHRLSGGAQSNWTARTELGLNANDWVLRSNQIVSRLGDRQRSELLDAYAQRTFASHATTLQLGQIYLTNPVLGGLAVNGAQVFPEQALTHFRAARTIEGVAQTQARLELRQGGRLIDTLLVPAGPFAVEPPSQVDANRALQVTIVEADGQRRELRQPAVLTPALDSAAGFTFGLGTLRDHLQSPGVLSAGWSGSFGPGLASQVGVLSSSHYQSAGFGLGVQPWTGAELSSNVRQAWLPRASDGGQGQVQLTQRLADNWQSSVVYQRQTSGYREFHDALPGSDSRQRRVAERDRLSLGVSWQHTMLGSLSLGNTQSRSSDGKRFVMTNLGWSKRFAQLTINGNVDWGRGSGEGRQKSVHLSASAPLGGSRRLRASFSDSGESSRTGVSINERINDQMAYDLGLERQGHQDALQSRIGMSLMSRYNHMRFDHADNGQGRRSLFASVRGAAVAHDAGLTLSPYTVQDTFALLNVGELSDVRVNTPSGPVWTDGQGRALAARVEPYGESPVQVEARSLPRNVELDNAIATVQARRGAVSQVVFDAYERRRLLLHASFDGQPLPAGASVSDEVDGFVTLVQNGGLIFVHDFRQGRRLIVDLPERGTCTLEFQPAEQADHDLYYETLPATCQAA